VSSDGDADAPVSRCWFRKGSRIIKCCVSWVLCEGFGGRAANWVV
jgi:hypothetical protein